MATRDQHHEKLTIKIPPRMHKPIKMYALEKDCNVRDVYQQICRTFVVRWCDRKMKPCYPVTPSDAVQTSIWLDADTAEAIDEIAEIELVTKTSVVLAAMRAFLDEKRIDYSAKPKHRLRTTS
ncbi:MAG: hypothetical protein V3W34_08210 [Phycisphaerae bacterium]